jgi:hypothetical protein
MLHCNMEPAMDSQWGLDDLLADLQHARKRGDLGRLAFVSYCDVRRWAREAGRSVLADQAARLITESPHQSRNDFLKQVDDLIQALEALRESEQPDSDPMPSAVNREGPRSGWAAFSAAV